MPQSVNYCRTNVIAVLYSEFTNAISTEKDLKCLN